MQYLLTEEEHKALADVNAKAEGIARDYRNRLVVNLRDALGSDYYFSPETKQIAARFRKVFDETQVIVTDNNKPNTPHTT